MHVLKLTSMQKKKGKRKKKNEDGKQNAYDEHGKDSESWIHQVMLLLLIIIDTPHTHY